MKGISVVICCYNSRFRLEPTLTHLANQDINGLSAELIIVDNNSNDGTANYASSQWVRLGQPYSLTIVNEPKQGLSNARHSGALAANFEYMVFCDDDNWLAPDYLMLACSIMNRDSKIGALGGFASATADVDFPDWFETFKGGYAISDESIESGFLPDGIYLTGAGMVLRRKVILSTYQDLPSLLKDRDGSELSSGGDTEICLRLKLMGFELYFEKKLKFKHFIPSDRLSESYRNSLFAGFKQHSNVIEFYQKLYWVQCANFSTKIVKSLIVVLKLPFTLFGLFKRWSLKRDLLMLYLITGIKFLNIPKEYVRLREFYIGRIMFF